MKHLTSFEKFAYHSPEESKKVSEKSITHMDLEKHKCLKCKKKPIPHYSQTTREISRLF